MSRAEAIICFMSSKGGSGKTVTSSSLGTFLSHIGIKVLMIDTDASTNGMTLLFLEQLLGLKESRVNGAYGLFEVRDGLMPSIVEISSNLSFLPAAYRLRDTESTDIGCFNDAIESVIGQSSTYDVILIDAQAGTDIYARIAAQHSDTHIIVSEYDPISAQGIDRLKIVFSQEMTPATTYTLFNKVLPEFADVIGEGLAIARYLAPIPWDADVIRAFSKRDLAIDFETPNSYTMSIAQLAIGCLPEPLKQKIIAWHSRALDLKNEPAKQRLQRLYYIQGRIATTRARAVFIANIFRVGVPFTLLVATFVFFFFTYSLADLTYTLSDKRNLIIAALAVALFWLSYALSTMRNTFDAGDVNSFTNIQDEISQLETIIKSSDAVKRISNPGPYASLRMGHRPKKTDRYNTEA